MFCKYFGFESFKIEERGEGKKYNKKKRHIVVIMGNYLHMCGGTCTWMCVCGRQFLDNYVSMSLGRFFVPSAATGY